MLLSKERKYSTFASRLSPWFFVVIVVVPVVFFVSVFIIFLFPLSNLPQGGAELYRFPFMY